jgi:hypothetical protein
MGNVEEQLLLTLGSKHSEVQGAHRAGSLQPAASTMHKCSWLGSWDLLHLPPPPPPPSSCPHTGFEHASCVCVAQPATLKGAKSSLAIQPTSCTRIVVRRGAAAATERVGRVRSFVRSPARPSSTTLKSAIAEATLRNLRAPACLPGPPLMGRSLCRSSAAAPHFDLALAAGRQRERFLRRRQWFHEEPPPHTPPPPQPELRVPPEGGGGACARMNNCTTESSKILRTFS